MAELPDITVYVERLDALVKGEMLDRVRLRSPFVLRSVEPGIDELEGRRVESLRRIGKRIVLGFDDELFLVIHLMIAGRLRWREPGAKIPGRIGHAASPTRHDCGTPVQRIIYVENEGLAANGRRSGFQLAPCRVARLSER